MDYYMAQILDISSNRPKPLSARLLICAESIQGATVQACKLIKKYEIYANDERVREYIQMLEIWNRHENDKNSIDCAGHEFDVLPEALREILLDITLVK